MKPVLRNSFIIITSACALGVLAVAGWFLMRPPVMVVQGEVEATHVQVASKIVGRVDDLLVRKGETVKQGQLIATIDSPEIRARLKQAEAARSAAGAQSEKAHTGAREEEIRQALNAWLKAKAGADLAVKTCDRIRRLNQDGVLPAQKLDEAEGQREAAQRTENAAKAAYEMAVSGARKEDVRSARAIAEQASGAVAEVSAYLGETRLLAPISGEVADVIPEKGELVAAGCPLVVLVNLDDVWVTFNLREDLLSRIRMGTVLTARFPALGNRQATLKVNYIADLGEFATWRATKASGDFDLKTFEVRAVPVEPIKGLRPGMSAIVEWDKVSGTDGHKRRFLQ